MAVTRQRTCVCGCSKKFTPRVPWQRFATATCASRVRQQRRAKRIKAALEAVNG